MQGNWPIFILAFSVLALGAMLVFFNRTRPNGLAHNFGLIVMVNGTIMVGGLIVFALLSAIISLGRGL